MTRDDHADTIRRVYVDDVDEHYHKARAAGAAIVLDPKIGLGGTGTTKSLTSNALLRTNNLRPVG